MWSEKWGDEGNGMLKGKEGSRENPRILPCETDGGGRQGSLSWGAPESV